MKIAILGAAHQHVDYALTEVARRDELELVGIAEPDPQLRQQFLNGVDARIYDSPQQLLDSQDVEVALVAGIYSHRAEAAVAALRAGAHVLADKPLCTDLEQLEAIRTTAREADRHVSIVFEKRFHPATIALRQLVHDGTLGTIAMIASTGPHKLTLSARPPWFLDRATYGGIAGDLPIHDIDLVLELVGMQQDEHVHGTVAALTGNVRPEDHPDFDDHVALLMRAGPVPATIEADWLGPEAHDVHGHYRMRVAGSEGTAEVDWAYDRLRVTTHAHESWEVPLGPPQSAAQHYFDTLLSGDEPYVTTTASLQATEVALKAQLSAEQNGSRLQF